MSQMERGMYGKFKGKRILQRKNRRTGGENRESGDTYEDLHSRQNTL